MAAYYNEMDAFAAVWIRRLIAAGHIADGVVDERSIEDIHPADLREFTQCHFFAGIGVWPYALRLAGWPDDRPVWTGSCPCQPFSSAGKGAGFADERHLWPAFYHLIRECQPPVVFGEQVASKDGLAWLDLVRADLEATGYAAGAADLCAASVGAPHIRQRLFWVADAPQAGRQQLGAHHNGSAEVGIGRSPSIVAHDAGCSATVGLADAQHDDGRADEPRWRPQGRVVDGRCGADGGLANASGAGVRDCGRGPDAQEARGAERSSSQRQWIWDDVGHGDDGPVAPEASTSPTHGFWADVDWLFCRDGKWRPVEPGTFPLAHGAAARVGRLRAYGNAIVPQVAETFIRAYLETRG